MASPEPAKMRRVCIVGASGKLGRYMIQHALDRGYEVVGVCRDKSVGKLDAFKGRITIVPGQTDDRDVIRRAVEGCDGVLVVLVPWGMRGYSTGTAQAVLDHARPGARLVFSCGWHITRDGRDVYSRSLKLPATRMKRAIGDPVLASNLTRRVDFALFTIVGCKTPSAIAHVQGASLAESPMA